MEERVTIPAPDGEMAAFFARPDTSEAAPGVVVLIEGFGLVGSIEDTARALSAAGYAAIVPDLFYREAPDNTARYDEVDKGLALQEALVSRGAAFLDDIAATMSLLDDSPHVSRAPYGVVGFCMGGSLAFATACGLRQRVGAASCFYGGGTSDLMRFAAGLRVPLMFSYGDQDAYVPMDEVQRVRDLLTELEVTFDLKVYEGAGHGFMNAARADYDPEAARDAWERLLAFFAANLR